MSAENKIPDNMVRIEIDDKEMIVPRGSMVIEAADNNGISIPRFCYHKKLSIAANCRMCMVDVEKVPKPLPACATPVMPDMKVYTKSKRAIDAQRNVMEFLLINHPLDCPICDQGGECELQDQSMGYGRGVSRYVDSKRVAVDEDIGSLISTDMTRCITCTRCVRFLDEITGTDELGGIGRGDRTQIGTAVGRSIDSVMSGNIIDLCPVGALTNKPFRFKARAWELMSAQGVSMHDAIGSNLYYHTRHGKILRTVPRDKEALNEAWISDRDRYGVLGQDADDRITAPMIKENGEWKETDWATAMDFAVRKLQAHDANNTAVLAGNQSTNEEYFLLHKLFKALGCDNIDYRLAQADFSQNNRLPRMDLNLDEVADNQQIVLIGSHVGHEQPILAHRIRQAWLKNGSKVSIFNPKQYHFNFETFHHFVGNQIDWVNGLGSLAHCVADLSKHKAEGDLGEWINTQNTDENLNNLAKALLAKDNNVLFVIGQIANNHPQASLIKALVAWLSNQTNGKVYEMASGANAVGAEICGMSAQNNVADILASDAKSFVIYQAENDDFANAYRAQIKLEDADSVVLMASFADENIKQAADVILPIGLASEVAGSYFNNFAQMQKFAPAAKLPDETKPGWRVLRVLGNMLNVDGFSYDTIDEITDEVAKLKVQAGSINVDVKVDTLEASDGFVLFNETTIYDVDMLTRRSQPLQDTVHASTDNLNINSVDAKKLGIENAMQIIINQKVDGDTISQSLFANIDDNVPAGSVNVHKCVGLRTDALNVTLIVGDSV